MLLKKKDLSFFQIVEFERGSTGYFLGKLIIVMTMLCYSKRKKQPKGAVDNVF